MSARLPWLVREKGFCLTPMSRIFVRRLRRSQNPQKFKQLAAPQAPMTTINWLKHGTIKKNGPRIENATIPASESIAVVWRAITKFDAVYNDQTPQMRSFAKWARDWLVENKNSN